MMPRGSEGIPLILASLFNQYPHPPESIEYRDTLSIFANISSVGFVLYPLI